MNIVCDKVLLSAAIDGVSKAVTMRSAIPVLEGILLKAEGFQLNLTGYDLEMGIVTTIEANVKEAGEVVLNAKLLSSMISRMPAGQVSILSAENGKTTIQSGVVQFEIQSMPANDFPELPNTGAEETLTIKTGVLKDMIDRTLYAVSQDEKKPAHTGELFEILPDKLTVVALDGYRLAIVERPVTAVKDIRIIVPSKTMTEVAHLLPNDDEEPVHISANRRYVVFMAGGYTIMSRLIEVESMHERKQKMANLSDGIIALPGGCGTLEELLEIITWKQLGLYLNPIIILNTNRFFDPLLEMLEKAIDENFMRRQHGDIWKVAQTPEEAVQLLYETPVWDISIRKFAAI
mgnify:CR=1 FL=1